jgi:hypothetical protein
MSDWGDSRVFASDSWQMTYGERAALEGLVTAARPEVAIEIGTAAGGSLDCVASHSGAVHAFDLEEPRAELPANVTMHVGDSRETLPRALAALEEAGKTVTFALVDGDHTAAGVRADLEALVGSAAVDFALIVLHDTMNPEVRRGILAAQLDRAPRVVYADLDLVPGFLASRGEFADRLWGGLGLVVVDSGGEPWREGIFEDARADPHRLIAAGARTPAALARRARRRLSR